VVKGEGVCVKVGGGWKEEEEEGGLSLDVGCWGVRGWGPDRPEEGGREHTDHKMTVLSCECVCVSVCECVCIMHTVSMCMDVCLQYERTC
jgi:hypothetical protein